MASTEGDAPQIPLGPEGSFSEITINGETYLPTPYEVNRELPEDYVWSQFPPNSLFISDPKRYDALGQDPIVQRRIWSIPTEQGQIDQFRQLLHERPDRGLDLMFAAAVKGKAYIIKFLLEQGVKATAKEAEGDDGSLVPLHAAAYQGRLDCVKVLMGEGKLGPNIVDDMGGTPLMRASWGQHPDIVQHLLEAGADITIRQNPNGDEPGTNAFEFACGSGCVECAELILSHALSLEIKPQELITRIALAAAAASNNPDMLANALNHGGYSLPQRNDGFEAGVVIDLTPDQTSAIEHAFDMSLRQSSTKALKPLFVYLASLNTDGVPNFSLLSDATIDSLIEALWSLAAHSDAEHLAAFSLVHDLLYAPASRFTNPAAVEGKAWTLGDAFFWAAQNGVLKMMKHIYSLNVEMDVNHLSRVMKPIGSTALYTAAAMGRGEVVAWLFETFGSRTEMGKGVGRFVNGPTALWIAVSNGEGEVVRALLARGGPVEGVVGDVGIAEDEGVKHVVVSATKAYRSPVVLWSEKAWREQHGDPNHAEKGATDDKKGIEMQYVVLEVSGEDAAWLGKVQIRRSDQELLKNEKNGRELKPKPRQSWRDMAKSWLGGWVSI